MSEQLIKNACSSKDVLPKQTLINFYDENNPTRTFLESINTSNWTITSYNSQNREVCITITDNIGERMLSLTIPQIVNN